MLFCKLALQLSCFFKSMWRNEPAANLLIIHPGFFFSPAHHSFESQSSMFSVCWRAHWQPAARSSCRFYSREQSSHCRFDFLLPASALLVSSGCEGSATASSALWRPRHQTASHPSLSRLPRPHAGPAYDRKKGQKGDGRGRTGRESVKGKKRQTWWRGGAASAAD